MFEEGNSIVVEKTGGHSRLVECLNHPPVKFINPRPVEGCCQVFISNYGGGMVGGDKVSIRIDCRPGSSLFLGTQSSNKIYRSLGAKVCIQETIGTLHANSFTVICPDPVVPFKGSRYRQSQAWEVHPEADLALFDWLQPGRAARGEVFAYDQVYSELRITRPGGRPALLERFVCDPENRNPTDCGRFGRYTSLLCAYFIGSRMERMMESLEPRLLDLNRRLEPGSSPATGRTENAWVGLGRREGVGYVLRALGGERRDVQPVIDLVLKALADPDRLGFNPSRRRW